MIIKTSYPFMKPPPSARLIRGHRLAQGLAAAYMMAENGGLQVFDLSGNGKRGTINGATWVSGKFGSALNFVKASSQYVDCGQFNLLDGLSAMSVVAWVNVSSDHNGMIIAEGNGIDEGWLLYTRLISNMFRFGIVTSNGSVNCDWTYGAGYPTGWHQLVGVYDGSNMRLYWDEVLKITIAQTGTIIAATNNLFIGTYLTATTIFFNGKVDVPAIYNRALNASEIAELYARPFCMFEQKARTALMSGYEVVAPPVGMAGAMTTNTGYWGY